MRLLIIFSYDGSKFCGFQRQNDKRSVQKDIEVAISQIYQKEILIKGAGRTDGGVHAIGQTATFDVPYIYKGLKRVLNNKLSDIKVRKIKKVNDNFHARFNARGKVYFYKIKLGSVKKSPYFLSIKNVDLKQMKKTSKLFLGAHNFKNFVSGRRDNYETYIDSIKFYRFFNVLYIKFVGAGFYRYMVRNLVGAIIDVGRGKATVFDIESMLNNPNTEKQLSTAVPNGLYLLRVLY